MDRAATPGRPAEKSRALLLDLDGTLIDLDLDRFLEQYARLLAGYFVPEVPPERFGPAFMEAAMFMLSEGHSDRSNGERFYDRFCAAAGVDPAWAHERAERFYDEAYPSLRSMVQPLEVAPEVVARARERGWVVVLATQPLFPRRAIVERMRWGGLDPGGFDFIAHMDAFHACKPHALFFEELCREIRVAPERCVMVGNDVHDDLPAAHLGMPTFLARDFVLRADHPAPPPRAEGSLRDLLRLIESGELEQWVGDGAGPIQA
ncbi:HAD family hydrolase [Limnochorda pilosa]|uniref:Hydrolase n=1 Tax=Limnochorda pilosa TaxID=1555112 RepID=A0A0K2SKU0_LIMPI|nr:HAD family hydrolase [Limnochorda pilosa]BAS27723.1 hydrolase [Limnochorda pilosa]